MPRYFFHLVEGERRFRDENGRELPNLIEAHTVALDIISKCLRYIPDWPGADARITVALGTATSNSVARRSSVCARNLSPITCFHLPMPASARARFVYPDAFCQAMRPWSAMCLRWRSRCVGALSAVSLGTASRPRMTRGRLLVEGRSARLAWERESALAVSRAERMKHEVPYLSSRAKGLLRSF